MHPDDMSLRGLRSGEAVELSTQGGRLKLPVRASSDLARGTVVVPHGLPGLSSNALLPSGAAHIEPGSGQHIMTGVPVEVRALRMAQRPDL
jgi:predicted molibdopterin-dependent oxidoreductase YjgC